MLIEQRTILLERRQHLEKEAEKKYMLGLVADFRIHGERLESLEASFASGKIKGATLDALRDKALTKPKVPDPVDRRCFPGTPYYERRFKKFNRQWWLPFMCRLRHKLADAAFRFGDGPDARFYLFLTATQQPFGVSLRLMEPADVPEVPPLDIGILLMSCHILHHGHAWTLSEDFACDHEFDLRDDMGTDIYVLPMAYVEDSHVYGDGDFMKFEHFIDMFPEVSRAEVIDAESDVPEDELDEEEAAHPWLKKHGNDMRMRKKRRTMLPVPGKVKIVDPNSSGDDDSDTSDEPLKKVHLDEDALRAYYESLEEWKEGWDAAHVPNPDKAFHVHYRAAPSTYAKKGMAVDFLRAEHTDAEAQRFLRRYRMQLSFDMSVTEHEPGVSGPLCEGWVHRMTCFFNMWKAAGADRAYRFSEADIAAYEEPDEITDLAPRLNAKGAARLAHLRSIRPRPPIV